MHLLSIYVQTHVIYIYTHKTEFSSPLESQFSSCFQPHKLPGGRGDIRHVVEKEINSVSKIGPKSELAIGRPCMVIN